MVSKISRQLGWVDYTPLAWAIACTHCSRSDIVAVEHHLDATNAMLHTKPVPPASHLLQRPPDAGAVSNQEPLALC